MLLDNCNSHRALQFDDMQAPIASDEWYVNLIARNKTAPSRSAHKAASENPELAL